MLFVSSIINPFIYCDFLRANITRFARFCVWFRKALRTYNRRMNNVAPAQEFEMKVLKFVTMEERNEGVSGAGERSGEEEGKLEGIMEEEEVEDETEIAFCTIGLN